MKNFPFNIDKHQAEWIFAPIRTRKDAIVVLMKTLKILMLDNSLPDELVAGRIVLQVSKMSRIFFISDSKVFSLAFPFFVTETEDGLSFKSHGHSNVNHKVSSDILSLLEAPDLFNSSSVYNFAEPVDDLCLMDGEIWSLFRELLMMEEGYIRYDHDPLHVKDHYHPLNHFDVFFSSNVTFKLGLHEKIEHKFMVDMLDSNTPCHYVVPVGK
ncbi:hypothetical protein ACO0K0_12110 [Undibacterium sp. SXout11W]|uniref:hypothetical protein n=1 Tax=Undibacterium sp. SXout11W TaxID=3413050 RepID=UPI003BF28323